MGYGSNATHRNQTRLIIVPPFPPYLLPYADISWQTTEIPYATQYDDVYWSSEGGSDEKHYVFVQGCQLPTRWEQLELNDVFTIAELGFGFGLNFLLVLREWLSKPNPGRLEYISYEKHLVPLTEIKVMARQLGLEHEFAHLSRNYPKPIPGPHTIKITANCTLTIVVGDAEAQTQFLEGHLDALFLDGFSPAKNQEMWADTITNKLAKQLRPGGLLATYSVAGHMRRNLISVGLSVTKASGYGKKRHMLVAAAPGQWRPNKLNKKHIAIIGAGLAGLFCANELAARGHQVSLIDQTGKAFGAVTDIQQIAIYPQLSQTPQPYSNLYLRAFHYFLAHETLHSTGRLELLDNEQKLHKGKQLAAQLDPVVAIKNAAECSNLLNLTVEHPGLFTPTAGWIAPQSIQTEQQVVKAQLTALNKTSSGWRLAFETEQAEFDAVVLATGSSRLAELSPLGLMPLRGQSIRLNQPKSSPACVFSQDKTWFPTTPEGASTVSGTYSRFDDDLNLREQDSQLLLTAIQAHQPNADYTAQAGIRCATRDRLPVVGELPDWQALDTFAKDPSLTEFNSYQSGLYVCLGFGSHGGTLGPYCANLLSRVISDDVRGENLSQLTTTRFAIRDGGVSRAETSES